MRANKLDTAKKDVLKSEESVQYSAKTDEVTISTMLAGSKLKLVGAEVPSIRIQNRSELERYCTALIGDNANEEFRLICVNSQCMVLSESCISCGDLSSVNVYVRNIVTIALLSNAHGVFLTHNHPGGTCKPSIEDIQSTAKIVDALKMFGIIVLDHIIVTPHSGSYSFASHGDLKR